MKENRRREHRKDIRKASGVLKSCDRTFFCPLRQSRGITFKDRAEERKAEGMDG